MTTSLSRRLRPLRALNHISALTIVFGLLFSYAGAASSLYDDVNLTLKPRLGRVQGRSIHSRAVQSAATCLSQFDWMDNSFGQSPCLTVAYLLSACSSGNWNVPSLPDADHHYSVTVENANGCQCSWAAYNTYQACSLCQGTDFGSAMRTWSGYNLNCTGHLSDPDYYPPDTPIPAETAIPFWATTDPSTWHNGKFDPTTAQSIKNEGHSDITETSRSESQNNKSSNTGAIVGGVVGGVLGLAALALIFFFLRRRHRYTRLQQQQQQQQNQGANLKHRPTFSTVRFSPSLLTHWRTGSSGTTATAATLGQPMGGKVAGQTAASYMYGSGAGGGILMTPSPGPTIPVSMTGSTGGGRPPLNSNSSSSYTSGHTMTNTPPLGGRQEYITRPAGKNYAYGIPQPIPAGQGGGYLTAMNLSHSNSNSNLATIAPSSASVTAGGASAIARNSHAHTLSNDSVGLSQYGGEPPEGTVVPFILPPTLPEPMGGESGPGAGGGAGGGVTSVPSAGSKGAHGRGPSDSSNVTSNTPAPVRASSPDLFTTAFNPARPPPERRNPPAYTPTSPPPPAGILPILPGIDGNTSLEEYGGADAGRGADGDGDGDGDALSVEAQRAETTLSGTTLRGQGTSSGRAPTTLGDDAVHNRPGGEWESARGERGEGPREERDRFGYPVDRKV